MTIRFSCANAACGKKFQVKDELAGRKAKCPDCGTVQIVPSAQEKEPILVADVAAETAKPAPAATTARPPAYPGADSLTMRFMGEGHEEGRQNGLPAANNAIEQPVSLQLLFPTLPVLDSRQFTQALRQYHPDMASGVAEIDPDGAANGTPYGLVGWGPHVVKLVGFSAPVPKPMAERCIAPAHYGDALKTQAFAHDGNIILYYTGYEEDTLEQFVALAAVCGVLARAGALVVCNESAWTSFPAAALIASDPREDMLEQLRTLPLTMLYCGFVKYNVPGGGVWMRTYGAHEFGLPDLAFHAAGHHQGEFVSELFSNTLDYLRNSGATFAAGHTMQLADEFFARIRLPTPAEPFLHSEGTIFVFEKINPREINR